MVSEDKVQVKTTNEVNCVPGGTSDPVVFSTAAAPLGTLTLVIVKKPMTSTDTVDPSLGITSFGKKFSFGPGKLHGFFTL